MNPSHPTKLPRSLRYQDDPLRPDHFQVVDDSGAIWAQGIPDETAARVFAATPGLLLGYDAMLEDVFAYFSMRWDIGPNGPDLEQFVEDEDELEQSYPGASSYARWLLDLRERSRAVRASDGGSPIAPYVEPQLDLF